MADPFELVSSRILIPLLLCQVNLPADYRCIRVSVLSQSLAVPLLPDVTPWLSLTLQLRTQKVTAWQRSIGVACSTSPTAATSGPA